MPAADAPLLPAALPGSGDPDRWPFLQRLRRSPTVELEPWLEAIETGHLEPQLDLLTALLERLSPEASLRLLRCWARQAEPDPQLPALLGRQRDPALMQWLLTQLQPRPGGTVAGRPEPLRGIRATALLPLLGHQRDRRAWPVLRCWLEAPIPAMQRRAALEGLAVGLPAWPRAALRRCLLQLATDLDTQLAGTAIDLLARLPGCRRQLLPLRRRRLDAGVASRLQRRLAATPVQPLLLVVHGRSGGVLPAELLSLAADLERQRGAPVAVQALTAAEPPAAGPLLQPGLALTLVPLLLLPGGHVHQDLPAIAAHWRRHTTVQRWPFLGAWPFWQQALCQELRRLQAPAEAPLPPLLLHHPLSHRLARRHLDHLAALSGGRCLPVAFEPSAADAEPPWCAAQTQGRVVLPLVLASNRLTERLPSWCATPLLQRPGLRQALLEALLALP